MSIHYISCLLICVMDCLFHFFFCRKSSNKVFQTFLHLSCDLINTFFFQLCHELCILLCILSCDCVDQTLQVAGDQNVHGWRRCQDKFSVSVIDTCLEEIKENLVIIRSTDQFCDRHAHLFCIICSKDISKVSCRNCNIDLLACLDLFILKQLCISIYIINNLRYKTSDIDGVC